MTALLTSKVHRRTLRVAVRQWRWVLTVLVMAAVGGPEAAGEGVGKGLKASAFRAIYPRQFYERFLNEGLRPDGRPLGRARPATIAVGAVSTANGSAHVKVQLLPLAQGLHP